MNILSLIRPRYIIAITLGIALLMFTSAYWELRQSREELLHVLHEHSLSLAETIERSSANVVLSSEYIEDQLAERLFNNAYFIARLDSAQRLTNNDLRLFAEANNIFRINIFDSRGKRIFSNMQPQGYGYGMQTNASQRSMIAPILRGKTERLVIGFREARFQDGERFAVAIRRTHKNGGAIVLNLDAAEILAFRKSIGIGRLISDLGNNSGIEYVVLQDSVGIIAATKSVTELSSIEEDTLLHTVFLSDTSVTRQIFFQEREVFEVIRALTIEGSNVGVLRIGLSMDEIRAVENRMWRRMIVMSLVLAVIGIIVVTAIIANQNFHLISQKYERTRAFTENILYNMQDIVVTLDDSERITIFNQSAEKFFGANTQSVVGKKLAELSDALRKNFEALLAMHENQSERALVTHDGVERIVAVSVSTTLKKNGTVESTTLLLKDRTEERRMEQEMQRKEKLTAMGELASGVAHEIRNPLNAISMIAQRYDKEFFPKKDVKQYKSLTQVLKKEASRVNSIVQQFLRFARPPKLKRGKIPAEQFVQHLSILFAPLAKKKGIKFVSTFDETTLNIDSEQMTQAILNLLQNALDATKKQGTISLHITHDNTDAVITVKDTGEGIPKTIREKIFNLYFTTKPNGTGLGLAITHQIIAQHGGSIDVNSEEGKGTSFIVRLPNV